MTFLRMPKVKPELPADFQLIACPTCGNEVENYYYWQQQFKERCWCGEYGSFLNKFWTNLKGQPCVEPSTK